MPFPDNLYDNTPDPRFKDRQGPAWTGTVPSRPASQTPRDSFVDDANTRNKNGGFDRGES